jgi:hypothetical protein
MAFEELIEVLKARFEAETGWGDSTSWTNHDFITLSELINKRTGVTLSHVTLKRIWGKVKYDSLPNTFTLDTLCNFVGYESWRKFVTAQNKNCEDVLVHEPATTGEEQQHVPTRVVEKKGAVLPMTITVIIIAAIAGYITLKKTPVPATAGVNYKFTSKKVVTRGLPNSVVFDYDAKGAPGDSVVIQQSWDKSLQVKVSKLDKQHTSIYYYPDFYNAKLIVNNKVVKQHEILIESDGWVSVVHQNPVPVYFNTADITKNGMMALPANDIISHNIKLQPDPPYTLYCNVKDFGEIYADDFTFETRLKNTYHEGAAICQNSNMYILCKGTAIGIPLCAKGCVSAVDLLFTNYFRSGKKYDLSAFGVDFSDFVTLRIESHNNKAHIYLNGKLVYTINNSITHSKIIGFDYRFQGTGAVDYIKMSNGNVNYKDDF